jgi:putative MFS transporter
VSSSRALSGYPLVLFVLLCAATFFEGFDLVLVSLVLPQVGEAFSVGPETLGYMLSWIGLGTVGAFVFVQLADRVGRRPVLLCALGGYALFTLATWAATDLVWFGAFQFAARMLMVVQLAMAYLILSEEMPAHVRGRANGLMGAVASLGAALPAVLLAPLEQSALGWRGLFLVGALPLLLLPVMARVVREPPVFSERSAAAPPGGLRRHVVALAAAPLRRRFLGITAVYFALNFWSFTTFAFFTLYVTHERGWTAEQLQIVIPLAVPFAFAGYVAGGVVMDRIGRRVALALFLSLGSVATAICFQATHDFVIAGAWILFQTVQGSWPIVNTVALELFPTEMRAAANGLSHNLLGRWGAVLGPGIGGLLAARLGSTGDAIALVSLVNLLALPAVALLPETRAAALAVAGRES